MEGYVGCLLVDVSGDSEVSGHQKGLIQDQMVEKDRGVDQQTPHAPYLCHV